MNSITELLEQQELFDKLSDKKSFEKCYTLYWPGIGYYIKDTFAIFGYAMCRGSIECSEIPTFYNLYSRLYAAENLLKSMACDSYEITYKINGQVQLISTKEFKFEIQPIVLLPYTK